mgnify:CR=1 FL=1
MAGASHLELRPVTELSGGERQMVFFARALAQQPDCLILDEPAGSLDLKHRAAMLDALLRLRRERGVTVLLVTHDLQLLEPGVDVVFAMSCGVVVSAGPPREILTEELLARVFDDPGVRTARVEGRTFVWSEPV